MVSVTTAGLSKQFSDTMVIDGLDLTVNPGELFFVLGPSGCGKTTLLRIIGGLTPPSAGTVRFNDQDVTRRAPRRRNVAMVFQNHALWPHMTAEGNVSFGLKLRHIRRAERRRRVKAMLSNVHMVARAKCYPEQLSGGEQQRIALARALATEPNVLLLDEPLSHLDAGLRLELRSEIRRICSQSQSTAIYVSHDHEEALALADRVAVMRAGRFEQVGTPETVYRRPINLWVATFCGAVNVVPGSVASRNADHVVVNTPLGRLTSEYCPQEVRINQPVTCAIRPECLNRHNGTGPNVFVGQVQRTAYLGHAIEHEIRVPPDHTIRFTEPPYAERNHTGEDLHLRVGPEDVLVYAHTQPLP